MFWVGRIGDFYTRGYSLRDFLLRWLLLQPSFCRLGNGGSPEATGDDDSSL
eukprot:m.74593 g.74593  ORF g.74593 m.74593 type:complete len:51 (+) comp10312_c0_seq1:32-184(+)